MNNFNIGDIVIYKQIKYKINNVESGAITMSSIRATLASLTEGVVIPKETEHYKSIKLYLPEILKKL